MSSYKLMLGNCLDTLKTLEDNSVDSIVTDPPYGLAFMGKKWDYDVPSVEIWAECLRVLKPGGHLLAFAGTRTQHRMAVRIEDAGFEIRDMIAWVYGSGFPKSLDVSKAIDKNAGAEREVVGFDEKKAARFASGLKSQNKGWERPWMKEPDALERKGNITSPSTDAAKQWQGWGTALKPALEPITVARKPFRGTVAANVLEHGTAALNIDACRVGNEPGRWPANLIHDGGEPAQLLGEAARFFYCPKASKKDRDEGLTKVKGSTGDKGNGLGRVCETCQAPQLKPELCSCEVKSWVNPEKKNNHPTVKPTALMRYLCRLVTPPGGTVLDPFMGSGSTGKAAMLEGFDFIGCELDEDYVGIARARIEAARGEERGKT